MRPPPPTRIPMCPPPPPRANPAPPKPRASAEEDARKEAAPIEAIAASASAVVRMLDMALSRRLLGVSSDLLASISSRYPGAFRFTESGRIISGNTRSSGVHLGKSAATGARDRIFSRGQLSAFGEIPRTRCAEHGGRQARARRNVAAKTRSARRIDQALADGLLDSARSRKAEASRIPVSRFQSSQNCAVRADANFGIKGTLAILYL